MTSALSSVVHTTGMRTRFALAVLLVIVAFPFLYARSQPATGAMPESSEGATTIAATSSTALYPLIRVVDGDTVVVFYHGRDEHVRLIGIDTPEVVDPRKPVECFGKEASAHMHTLVDGKAVAVELDPSQGTRDKYGRLLAYLFLPDGTNVNLTMIASGYAHEYTYRLPYKYQAQFKAAEKAVRDQKLGLWADAACAAQSARS